MCLFRFVVTLHFHPLPGLRPLFPIYRVLGRLPLWYIPAGFPSFSWPGSPGTKPVSALAESHSLPPRDCGSQRSALGALALLHSSAGLELQSLLLSFQQGRLKKKFIFLLLNDSLWQGYRDLYMLSYPLDSAVQDFAVPHNYARTRTHFIVSAAAVWRCRAHACCASALLHPAPGLLQASTRRAESGCENPEVKGRIRKDLITVFSITDSHLRFK